MNRAPVPPVRLNPDLPLDLERIINKALEKDRALRYQHASDMRADLKRLQRDTSSSRVSVAGSEEPSGSSRSQTAAPSGSGAPPISSGRVSAAGESTGVSGAGAVIAGDVGAGLSADVQ